LILALISAIASKLELGERGSVGFLEGLVVVVVVVVVVVKVTVFVVVVLVTTVTGLT